jgi:hypothetical protein
LKVTSSPPIPGVRAVGANVLADSARHRRSVHHDQAVCAYCTSKIVIKHYNVWWVLLNRIRFFPGVPAAGAKVLISTGNRRIALT